MEYINIFFYNRKTQFFGYLTLQNQIPTYTFVKYLPVICGVKFELEIRDFNSPSRTVPSSSPNLILKTYDIHTSLAAGVSSIATT